jgi:hypothetical protein
LSQYQHLRGAFCLHLQDTTLNIEEVVSHKSLVSVYKTSWYCMPKPSNPWTVLWELTTS